MTLDEAIEELSDCMSETEKILYPEALAAHKLLIEAGKREMLFRERVPKKEWSLLPGETED